MATIRDLMLHATLSRLLAETDFAARRLRDVEATPKLMRVVSALTELRKAVEDVLATEEPAGN